MTIAMTSAMTIAGGIDLGGTKIEAQRFDAAWQIADRRRVDTPKSYPDLVQATRDQLSWLRAGHPELPVGIAAAGLLRADGQALAANLPSHGNPFPADVAAPALWLNDCRAFTQAEAHEAQSGTLMGLVLGTGIGGAVAVDGRLLNAGRGQSGEFGHMPLSAAVAQRFGLPLVPCGCGRLGCVETYGAGPGMTRLAQHLIGQQARPEEITAGKDSDPQMAQVWQAWCAIIADLLLTLTMAVDPDEVVLGGGLSQAPGLVPDLQSKLDALQWPGFTAPRLRLARLGATAAAFGAAYAAWRQATDV